MSDPVLGVLVGWLDGGEVGVPDAEGVALLLRQAVVAMAGQLGSDFADLPHEDGQALAGSLGEQAGQQPSCCQLPAELPGAEFSGIRHDS